MNLSEPDAPEEEDRTNSQSVIDFTYWMLSFVETAYPKSTILSPNIGDEEDGGAMMQAIMYSSSQVDLKLVTPDYDLFRSRCEKLPLTQEQAFRKRGAMLFVNKGVVMSLGDGKRIMEYRDDDYLVRYLTYAEKRPDYWVAGLVPEMIYL